MLLKPDQERVKVLLKDTMTLLCKNGLEFEGKFRIEALVGITLDDKNVFLMNFDEIIKSDQYRTPRNSDDEIKSSKHSSRKRRRFAKELKTPHSDSKSHSSDNDVCSEEEKIETNTEDEASSVPMKRTQPSASDDIVIIKDEANDWDDYQEDEQQMEFPQFNAPSQSANSHGNQEGLQLSGMMLEEVSNQEDQEMWPQKSIGNLTSTPGQSMNFSGLSDGAQQAVSDMMMQIGDDLICPICNKAFTQRQNLLAHLKWHFGQYTVYCQICNKGFMSHTTFKGHMARHTGVKEYKCDFCGKEYTQKHVLKRHIKHFHARSFDAEAATEFGSVIRASTSSNVY